MPDPTPEERAARLAIPTNASERVQRRRIFDEIKAAEEAARVRAIKESADYLLLLARASSDVARGANLRGACRLLIRRAKEARHG